MKMTDKIRNLILILLTTVLKMGVASCSQYDEPEMPKEPDTLTIEFVDVQFNDSVLYKHWNVYAWNKTYNLSDDYIPHWYTEYFKDCSIYIKKDEGISFISLYCLESMSGIESIDEYGRQVLDFDRRTWENHRSGHLTFTEINDSIYDCAVYDSDIKVRFSVTLKAKKEYR